MLSCMSVGRMVKVLITQTIHLQVLLRAELSVRCVVKL